MMTKEDLKKMEGNLRKIATYCRENYVPQLEEGDSLSVAFGEIKSRWGSFGPTAPEPKYSFGFGWRGNVWFRTGNLIQVFADDSPPSIYNSPVYSKDLLLEWQAVKSLIVAELAKRAAEKEILDEFEV